MKKKLVPAALAVAIAFALGSFAIKLKADDHFVTLRTARAGETFRGVALAPVEHDRDDHAE